LSSARRWRAGLLWLAVTAGGSLAAVELGVRALGLAPALPNQYAMFVADPVLPHRPRPGSVVEGRSLTGEFDFRYAHNSLGWRGPEPAPRKPPGSFRILGLGDSFTYGAGVDVAETYLARLEQRLAARGPGHARVEVVNAGIPSFFPEAERLLLEHYGLPLEPDLVIVGFVANDVIDTHLGLESIEVLPDGRIVTTHGARLLADLGPWMLVLYERWHSFRIPVRRWLAARIADERPVRPEEVLRAGGFHEEAWREVERQYDRMLETSRAHGAGFVLVYLPQQGPWPEAAGYPAARLGAWAARAGVPFVDGLAAMRASPEPERLHWPEDRHPTAAGHQVIADAIFETLTALGVVP
jgi:lysophospholipase L1-like esterase